MNKQIEVQRFQIDQFTYELRLMPAGSVTLSLVDGYAKGVGNIRRAYRERDPFERFGDYDPSDFGLTGDEDLGVNAFALGRECVNRIAGWANRVKPGYFILSPSTQRKEGVYDRIAKIIDRKVKGYSHQKIKKSHYFFRK